MIDEGPSSEDLDHFNRDTGFCPECGAEVWDQADICPHCFSYLAGEVSRHKGKHARFRRFATLAIILALILGMLAWLF